MPVLRSGGMSHERDCATSQYGRAGLRRFRGAHADPVQPARPDPAGGRCRPAETRAGGLAVLDLDAGARQTRAAAVAVVAGERRHLARRQAGSLDHGPAGSTRAFACAVSPGRTLSGRDQHPFPTAAHLHRAADAGTDDRPAISIADRDSKQGDSHRPSARPFAALARSRPAGLDGDCDGLASPARPADVLRAGSRRSGGGSGRGHARRVGPVPATPGPAQADLPAAFAQRGQSRHLRAPAAGDPGPAESRLATARGRPAGGPVPRTGPRQAGRPVGQPHPDAPANRLLLQSAAVAGQHGHSPHPRTGGR